MKSLLLAFQFLTILPIHRNLQFLPEHFEQSLRWFFLVGLCIGAAQYLLAEIFSLLQISALWSSIAIVTFSLWITGGVHLDGVADVADGFGAGHDRESILRIMSDTRLGVFGVSAIFLLLTIKLQATRELLIGNQSITLLIAPLLGRTIVATVCSLVPYAKEEGKGKLFGNGTFFRHSIFSLLCCGLIFLVLIQPRMWIVVPGAIVVSAVFAAYSFHKIRGFTGDTLGCQNELAEVTTLLLSVALE